MMRHALMAAAALGMGRPAGATEVRNVTKEGKTFVSVRTKLLDLLVAPHSGGQMTSLIYRARGVQMGNRGSLDWGLFSDHDLKQAHPGELMRAAYRVRVAPVAKDGRATIHLSRLAQGGWRNEIKPTLKDMLYEKTYTILPDAPIVRMHMRVTNRSTDLGRSPRPDELEPITRVRVQAGRNLPAIAYVDAINTVHRESRRIASFFARYDIFLTPTLATPPVPLGAFDTSTEDVDAFRRRLGEFSPYCSLANLTGQPAMSVPIYWGVDSTPIGVHFTGRFGDEATLFRLAGQLEAARPWAARRPALS